MHRASAFLVAFAAFGTAGFLWLLRLRFECPRGCAVLCLHARVGRLPGSLFLICKAGCAEMYNLNIELYSCCETSSN